MRTAVVGAPTDPPRVAFSIGRPVGNAVARNQVRRRLRAAVREHADLLQPGSAYLIGARPAAAKSSFAELSTTLRAILRDIARDAS